MTNDVLVGRTALPERLQLVHVRHVRPQRGEAGRDLELPEGFGADADVLEPGHELAVEAGHGVAGEEAGGPLRHEVVDPLQVRVQRLAGLLGVRRFEFSYVHFKLGVEVFDEGGDLLVLQIRSLKLGLATRDTFYLNEQVVPAWYVLHDVPFDFFVLEDGHASVDEDRRRCRFEVRAEIGWGFLHVHCGHF